MKVKGYSNNLYFPDEWIPIKIKNTIHYTYIYRSKYLFRPGAIFQSKIFRNIIIPILVAILISACDLINPPDDNGDNSIIYSSTLSGKVFLEHQIEHSNALVYIDSLNRGVSTDSSGNYTLSFGEEDSVYSGEFKIIYFLNDYDKDSAKIVLVNGKVKLDTLDVDSEGNIKTKEMKQIVMIEGCTDKAEYRAGDKVTFTARVTNLANRTIHISIHSCSGELSNFVFLYNDKYQSFTLGGIQDVLTLECDIYLPPDKYYEGKISYEIFEYRPLVPDEYIVATGFFIEDRLLNQFQSKFNKYVLEEWYKIHRGATPKLDWFPNKYIFPHIKIIE
ncbi:MAG: hypothetical protein KAU06_06740 [Candidatus Marinimicrobia bacterium]|nr:hypothetical protein [Candidatus Neomarinimicrobiota bacterium]